MEIDLFFTIQISKFVSVLYNISPTTCFSGIGFSYHLVFMMTTNTFIYLDKISKKKDQSFVLVYMGDVEKLLHGSSTAPIEFGHAVASTSLVYFY